MSTNSHKISFFVPGHPKTAGSKKAISYQRRDGSQGTRVIDTCAAGANWREMVAITARPLFPTPLEGPLGVAVTFFMDRPKNHINKAGLKRTAPRYPMTRPDTTKMLRAAEDALTGIAWNDDAQIVTQVALKRFADRRSPGVFVEVYAFEFSEHTPEETK
ncbi:MAG TPA: RusA family crossover junction endodeoxyribonuclease [Armatimonadota bacterium]|nr:RusA family crossover junction endodeoxyribonuclease [Armatimonadota bacterium]